MYTSDDAYLFHEGSHAHLFEHLGAHLETQNGIEGTRFSVWAPNAQAVFLIGDWNHWNNADLPLARRNDDATVWERFIPGVRAGAKYKYHIVSTKGQRGDKADPFGFAMEAPPQTASVVADLAYTWDDAAWMAERRTQSGLRQPMSVYEVHLGSWMRPGRGSTMYSYREIAPKLIEYVKSLQFTHVEFLPVMEHPFYGSWGYQITGFFAATSRYGSPTDLMWLIDELHRANIGVILDWVPGHFPSDAHGLTYFDGTHLFESDDPRRAHHPEWNSLIFDYSRPEVRSFLVSSALFWLKMFHADGLRIDGVASMLYLDYARKEGEWTPNIEGGRENLEAVQFLRRLNATIRKEHPDVHTIAEDSTTWPMVTRSTEIGGLGFRMKWDMGWMHDMLKYLHLDPIHRKFHHNQITFRSLYAFNENYMMPLSHDEVVHLKGSLIKKMFGDDWQQRANLRLLFGTLWAQPGKKLLFMGGEFAQAKEWDHDSQLQWELLKKPGNAGVLKWVADLNNAYRTEPALHHADCDSRGFEWIDGSDVENSVITFLRKGTKRDPYILIAVNYTPIPRYDYWVGVPCGGRWEERLNSDAPEYGGSGVGNLGGVEAEDVEWHGRPHKLRITLPPLSVTFLKATQPPTDVPEKAQLVSIAAAIAFPGEADKF